MANVAVRDNRVKRILVSARQIEQSATNVAAWIDKSFKGLNPLLIGILKGCIPFFSKVMTRVSVDCEIDFMYVTSFLGKTSAQNRPKINDDLSTDVKNRHIVIIEDVVDSGKTLVQIKQLLLKRGALSVKIAALLDKPEGRKVELEADLVCHTIPNVFVVGFGLDFEEKFRNLPFICELNE